MPSFASAFVASNASTIILCGTGEVQWRWTERQNNWILTMQQGRSIIVQLKACSVAGQELGHWFRAGDFS